MTQDDVEVPVPLVVGQLDDGRVLRHADDVDDPVDTAELCLRVVEQLLHVVALGRVARVRHTTDLRRDVDREVRVDVDAHQPGAGRRQRVRRLSADPLPGADDHEAAAVEPQQPRVVGDGGVVAARHRAEIMDSTATSRRSSSGMISVPSRSSFTSHLAIGRAVGFRCRRCGLHDLVGERERRVDLALQLGALLGVGDLAGSPRCTHPSTART